MSRKETKWVCILYIEFDPYTKSWVPGNELYTNTSGSSIRCAQMYIDKQSNMWSPVKYSDYAYVEDIPDKDIHYYAVGNTKEEAIKQIPNMIKKAKKYCKQALDEEIAYMKQEVNKQIREMKDDLKKSFEEMDHLKVKKASNEL